MLLSSRGSSFGELLLTLLFCWLTNTAGAGILGPWLDEEPVPLADTGIDAGPTLPDVEPPQCDTRGLVRGELLPELPELYTRWEADRTWGTRYMNDTIISVAEEMAFILPEGDPIVIGDISRKGGGLLLGHKSHRNGVDADIGLYSGDNRQPADGAFHDLSPSTWDVEANWLMIKAMLDTGRVKFILLDQVLINDMRKWLLENRILERDEVDRIFPPPGTPRTWEMDGIVRHASGHRNHLHLRVRCR